MTKLILCKQSTWPGNCLAVFMRDCWLNGPATCVYTGLTFLPQWLYCSGKQGRVAKGQVIWYLASHGIVHDVGSLCISTMLLINFFLLKRTLKQELQTWQPGPRDTPPNHHKKLPPPTTHAPPPTTKPPPPTTKPPPPTQKSQQWKNNAGVLHF